MRVTPPSPPLLPLPPPGFAIAWWLWMVGQAVILGLFSHRVPLSANYPEPIEATAPVAVAVTQVCIGVLLAPLLLANVRAVAIALVSSLPLLMLGIHLSGQPPLTAWPLVVLCWSWFLVFGLGSSPLAHRLLTTLCLLGPVLYYLRLEFSSHLAPPPSVLSACPPMAVGFLCHDPSILLLTLLWPAGFGGVLGGFRFVAYRFSTTQP
ncbi:MAG: hypothetical protein ACTHM6_07085 [Tepidisphaeraceae bacterium]